MNFVRFGRSVSRVFRLVPVLALMAVLFGVPAAMLAQSPDGTIVGVVTDTAGAVIPGATVIAISKDTGTTRTELTGANGSYRFESLLPGTYKITASSPNFSSTELEGLVR